MTSYHSAKYAGCDSKAVGGSQKKSKKKDYGLEKAELSSYREIKPTSLLVHTVEPPPFLDISLPSASLLNYFINLLLFIPSLVHLRPKAYLVSELGMY